MKKFFLVVSMCVFIVTIKAQQNDFVDINNNSIKSTYNGNHSDKSGFFPSANNSNSGYLLRSTLGVSGASEAISSKNGSYIVSQSVGQTSVIGTYTKKGYTIRQGFQQPSNSSITILQYSDNLLDATVYPNPFKHSVNISIKEKISCEIYVNLYDIKGSKVFNKKYPASQLVIIPLTELDNGVYILKVTSKDKILIVNLVKN